MVKLQKRFAYNYKDKPHFKHVITVPEDIVGELGWREGAELDTKIVGSELVVGRREGNDNVKRSGKPKTSRE